MRFLIKFEVFETITNGADVKRIREIAGKQLQYIQSSGKLVEGGMFGDKRGGFLLVDLEKSTDLYDLMGTLLDNCHVESHPVLSFEELGEFFKNNPPG